MFNNKKKFREKFYIYFKSFEKKMETKQKLFSNIPFDMIQDTFIKCLTEILLLNPDSIDVDISDDEYICMFILFKEKSVFFDLAFYYENDKIKKEALINIGENKKTICSYSSYDINKVIDKLRISIK